MSSLMAFRPEKYYANILGYYRQSKYAVFGKVYRTIFQHKRRRLVFKTGVIMYFQNDTWKNYSNIFKVYIYIYLYLL